MATTSFSLSVKGTDSNDKSATKTFSGVDSDITVAFGTTFANVYLALTTLTPSTMTITDKTIADLNGS